MCLPRYSFCEVNRQTLSFLGEEKKIKNPLSTNGTRARRKTLFLSRRLSTPEYRLIYSSYYNRTCTTYIYLPRFYEYTDWCPSYPKESNLLYRQDQHSGVV